tara:strand:- start:820 stop:1494 length:675 start_codon:yes stop_codon:yes gene_type:complete
MAIITTNGSFGATAAVTSTTLNAVADAATFSDPVDGTSLELKGDGKLGIKDAGVTKAKIENISAPLRVLGRTTAGAGVAEEVTINDNDDLSGASAITLATDESIKAYVDSSSIIKTTGTAPYYGCRAFASYNGSTQVLNNGANITSVTRNSTGTYTFNFDVDMPDVNYSLVVGGTFYGQVNDAFISAFQTTSKTTSSFQIKAVGGGPSTSTFIDQPTVDVAVFR